MVRLKNFAQQVSDGSSGYWIHKLRHEFSERFQDESSRPEPRVRQRQFRTVYHFPTVEDQIKIERSRRANALTYAAALGLERQ